MTDRVNGTVKWFSLSKGYGFIERDDGQRPEIFVHARDLPPGYTALEAGQPVSCNITLTPKGVRAINISLAAV